MGVYSRSDRHTFLPVRISGFVFCFFFIFVSFLHWIFMVHKKYFILICVFGQTRPEMRAHIPVEKPPYIDKWLLSGSQDSHFFRVLLVVVAAVAVVVCLECVAVVNWKIFRFEWYQLSMVLWLRRFRVSLLKLLPASDQRRMCSPLKWMPNKIKNEKRRRGKKTAVRKQRYIHRHFRLFFGLQAQIQFRSTAGVRISNHLCAHRPDCSFIRWRHCLHINYILLLVSFLFLLILWPFFFDAIRCVFGRVRGLVRTKMSIFRTRTHTDPNDPSQTK